MGVWRGPNKTLESVTTQKFQELLVTGVTVFQVVGVTVFQVVGVAGTILSASHLKVDFNKTRHAHLTSDHNHVESIRIII